MSPVALLKWMAGVETLHSAHSRAHLIKHSGIHDYAAVFGVGHPPSKCETRLRGEPEPK